MVYFNGFNDKEDVFQQFAVQEDDQEGIKIIYAWYNREDYEGSAFVLFEKNQKLYEVNGSHCSCHGLEKCWSPEETSVKELTHRMENGSYWYGPRLDELKLALKRWKQRSYGRARAAKKGK